MDTYSIQLINKFQPVEFHIIAFEVESKMHMGGA